MNIRNNYKTQSGLTLLELMIAMVIGIVLLMGTVTMFISNKQSYKVQEEMGRLQENARFAMEMLIRDIRMAGYSGCADDITKINNTLNGGDTNTNLFSMNDAVEGSESAANWQPSNSTHVVADILAGTDGITVRYLDPAGISISEAMPNVSAQLKVTTVGDLQEGDIIALSDCSSADIMEITQIQTASSHLGHNQGNVAAPRVGNATSNLSKSYGEDAEIMRFIARRYFIGDDDKGPALFRVHNGGSAEEIIEGVQNMQILYGEDTNNDFIADIYRIAADVANWENIITVRLALLMRTLDQNFGEERDTRTYDLLGTVVGPFNDNFRRRVFTSTVLIRNRSQ